MVWTCVMSNEGLLRCQCAVGFYSWWIMFRGRGQPKLTWNKSVKKDLEWNISMELAMDRSA
jgi:hypothetical protein